jgi:hypothetical protein
MCWGSIIVICRWSLPVCPWYYFGDALMIVWWWGHDCLIFWLRLYHYGFVCEWGTPQLIATDMYVNVYIYINKSNNKNTNIDFTIFSFSHDIAISDTALLNIVGM